MKNYLFLVILITALMFSTSAFATNYQYRGQEIQGIENVGAQNYDVVTVTHDNSSYANVALSFSSFYSKTLRIYNTGDIAVNIKLNSNDAFTVPSESILTIDFDSLTKVEVKSTTSASATVEFSLWGRNDIDV